MIACNKSHYSNNGLYSDSIAILNHQMLIYIDELESSHQQDATDNACDVRERFGPSCKPVIPGDVRNGWADFAPSYWTVRRLK